MPLSCNLPVRRPLLAHFATLRVSPRKARSVLLHSSKAQRSTYPPTQGASCCTGRRGLTVTRGCLGCNGCIGIAAAAETCTHRSGELLPSADAQRSVVWPRAAQKSIAWSTARVSSPMKRGLFVSKQQARALASSSHFHCGGRLPCGMTECKAYQMRERRWQGGAD